jgi:hypothetical protein
MQKNSVRVCRYIYAQICLKIQILYLITHVLSLHFWQCLDLGFSYYFAVHHALFIYLFILSVPSPTDRTRIGTTGSEQLSREPKLEKVTFSLYWRYIFPILTVCFLCYLHIFLIEPVQSPFSGGYRFPSSVGTFSFILQVHFPYSAGTFPLFCWYI